MASSKDAEATADLVDWVLEPSASGCTSIFHQPTGCRHFYTHAPNLIRGVPHPPFIQESIWEAQRRQLVFRADDVFISAFSKCGTTLAEQIVLVGAFFPISVSLLVPAFAHSCFLCTRFLNMRWTIASFEWWEDRGVESIA